VETMGIQTHHLFVPMQRNPLVNNEVITLEIKTLIENIELSTNQLKTVEKTEELTAKLDSPIFSISGIGIYTGTSILSKIDDIHNFSSALLSKSWICGCRLQYL